MRFNASVVAGINWMIKSMTKKELLEQQIREEYGDYLFDALKDYDIDKLIGLIEMWNDIPVDIAKRTVKNLKQMIIWRSL